MPITATCWTASIMFPPRPPRRCARNSAWTSVRHAQKLTGRFPPGNRPACFYRCPDGSGFLLAELGVATTAALGTHDVILRGESGHITALGGIGQLAGFGRQYGSGGLEVVEMVPDFRLGIALARHIRQAGALGEQE